MKISQISRCGADQNAPNKSADPQKISGKVSGKTVLGKQLFCQLCNNENLKEANYLAGLITFGKKFRDS